jgi:tetratricopeptide (TPR) repeat protein
VDSTTAAAPSGFRRWLAIASLSLAVLAPPALADWREISSDHFVIYADQGEDNLKRFAERLERFHAAMALRYPSQDYKPSPSNRVTVFVVANRRAVQELRDPKDREVAGFYRPRAGATVAVVPKLARGYSKFELSPETILLHEYAHHFMYGLSARAYPRWFVEGFAEFFAGARFEADGSVGLGLPALYRSAELIYGRDVPMEVLLAYDGGAGTKASSGSFYGQSWLLFHYLMFEPSRADQLTKYQALLAKGTPAVDAARLSFGEFERLARDLQRYQMRKMLSYMKYAGADIRIGTVTARTLRPGEAAMMPTRIESRLGVSREEALALLPEARRVAALYPGDPAVLAALAEAEYDAGNDDAAIGAADRALAINPSEIDARIQKGYAMYHKAKEAKGGAEAWQAVRSEFVKANKLEVDHPIPLVRFYETYLQEGTKPPQVAIDGLEWAMVLAPYDPALRWTVAQQMIADDRLAVAARTLGPLAYSPHPGEDTEDALRLLKEVEGKIAGGEGRAAR